MYNFYSFPLVLPPLVPTHSPLYCFSITCAQTQTGVLKYPMDVCHLALLVASICLSCLRSLFHLFTVVLCHVFFCAYTIPLKKNKMKRKVPQSLKKKKKKRRTTVTDTAAFEALYCVLYVINLRFKSADFHVMWW